MTRADWYAHFFDGVALDLWRFDNPAAPTAAEVEFLEDHLDLQAASRLLDVPCGNGRHAIELAARGHRVTGIDLSAPFLEEARAEAAARGVEIDWIRADMRQIPGDAAFGGAYCFGNSFGYLDAEGMADFCAALGRALSPGGRFVLDTGMAAESLLLNLQEREWMEVGDILLLLEHHYAAADSRLETRYTFIRDGRAESRSSLHLVYTVAEIRALLSRAGLATIGLYGSTDGEPFELGSPRLLLVAEKGRA